jgi:hypothetical protein
VRPEDEMRQPVLPIRIASKRFWRNKWPGTPVMIEDNKKPPKSKAKFESKSKADNQSHKRAKD